jgi:hypothetical protein
MVIATRPRRDGVSHVRRTRMATRSRRRSRAFKRTSQSVAGPALREMTIRPFKNSLTQPSHVRVNFRGACIRRWWARQSVRRV